MEILFVLVPVSALLMGIAIWIFIRAVDTGQFDNLSEHALDIFDDQEEKDNGHT